MTITGDGTLTAKGGSNCGYNAGIAAGTIDINGKIHATGIKPDNVTFSASSDSGIYASTSININESAELIATGSNDSGKAIAGSSLATLINNIAGTGWTDTEGTAGKADIAKGEHGINDLENYKKVQFPKAPDPAPSGGGSTPTVNAVDKVVKMINDLPEPDKVTVNDEKAIREAREAYNALSDTERQDSKLTQAVKNKLGDCETALDKAKKADEDQKAADGVSKQIAVLPDDPAKASEADAQAAYGAYMALTDAQKALLSDDAKQKVAAYKYFYEVKYAEAQKVKMSSAKAKKGGKAVVKWKKNKAADGYLLYYKAKGVKAKKVNIKNSKTVKTTVKKLKDGKVYSFKVRSYTKVNDPSTGKTKNVYGKWSKAKKVRAKK